MHLLVRTVFLFMTSYFLVKHCSIDFLRKEKNNLVKRAICGMVSAIANIEVPKNGWDEMKETIISVFH